MSGDVAMPVLSCFAADHYERILILMADTALLPPTHEAWRQGFDERIADLARRAVHPVVVMIDPDRFANWCAALDLPCDAHARLEYAEWLAGPGSSSSLDREAPARRHASPAQSMLSGSQPREPMLADAAA